MSVSDMNKTGIEYLTHTWNFYTGCLNHLSQVCDGGGRKFNCWAMTQTKRFPERYPQGFAPTFHPDRFNQPTGRQRPRMIGVCFMGDLGGDWLDPDWPILGTQVTPRQVVQEAASCCPQHIFLFLTKCPWNWKKWEPWPDNCWLGATVTDQAMADRNIPFLLQLDATVRYVSIEPMLGSIDIDSYLPDPSFGGVGSSWYEDEHGVERWDLGGKPCQPLNWVIIGGATSPLVLPPLDSVLAIESVADKANIPIFEKNNLALLFDRPLRQEYPGV